MATGHDEAAAMIAGETGFIANKLEGVIVFADGRTEHVALFTPSKTKAPTTDIDKAVK